MTILIDNRSGQPIYEQIYEQLRAQILSGAVAAEEALPSIRSLAKDLRISVITTKRAYEELERDGFIESFTGKGSFVKAQNTELFREEQLKEIEAMLTQAGEKARRCGITLAELTEILKIVYGGDES